MNHVCVGALLPFLIMTALYLRQRRRASLRQLILAPILMAAGALWAIVPDLPRYVGWNELYFRLSSDPRSNLFFFHHYIDLVESDSPYYNVAVILMAAALFVVVWRELRRREEA